MYFKYKLISARNIRVLTLLLIIVQSIGIRFLPNQGAFLSVVIIFLSRSGISNLKKKDIAFLFFTLFFLLLNKTLNASFPYSGYIFQYTLILCSYIFILQYKSVSILIADLYQCLKLIYYHAIAGYLLLLLASPLFISTALSGMAYKTMLFIFYVSDVKYSSFYRNVGLCWEPGLLQLLLNLFLFFSIKKKKSIYFLAGIVLTVITTFSTTGFLILGLNFLYFIIINSVNKKNKSLIFIYPALFITVFSLIQHNTSDKFDDKNTSGLARLRDYLIGVELISEKPLIGHGIFDNKYLKSKTYVRTIETDVFSNEYLEISGEMSGGYTNGFLALICWYGLPAALYIYILLFKNRFTNNLLEKIVFSLILLMTCCSEPITNTSFFLLFSFSYIVFNKKIVISINTNSLLKIRRTNLLPV